MADPVRPHGPDQIWITRKHLAALGVTTLAIAALTFFLGMRVGRSTAPPPPTAVVPGLTPDQLSQEQLEALLREVARQRGATDFQFPTELSAPASAPALQTAAPVEANPTQVGAPPDAAPPPEAAPSGTLPSGGWALQVGSYSSLDEANARLAELQTANLKAYRVAALVDGALVQRVRIGGYGSEQAARDAAPGLREAVGDAELTPVPAP